MSSLITGGACAGSAGLASQSTECKKQYAQGGGGGTFTTYEQRQAEMGGGEVEVLYGLDKELAEKAAAKYDPALEAACREWIEAVTGEKLGEMSLQQELKSGFVLCQLVNKIQPGVCPAPSGAKMPFKQMENIGNYLAACQTLGMPQHDTFQTVALYENKDMLAVLTNLQSLGRISARVPGYSGPTFGAKLADATPREFTQEQLRAGLTEQTFLGKGSSGTAGAAMGAQFDTSKEIVKCASACSNAPTKFGMGSSGTAGAAMGAQVDTSRNIVKHDAYAPSITSGMGSMGLASQSTECKKQYAQGGGGGTFTTYEQRQAEMGGGEVEVLYGLDKELAEKAAAKYDPALEAACREWIEAVTGEKLGEMSLQQELKSGFVLCQLVNKIQPGVCPAPSGAKMPFKQMENIGNYLAACQTLGMPQHDTFQTVALYENKDMLAVLTNLQSLGRISARVPGYSGPTFGAKLADATPREFTQEQLRAGLTEQTFLGKGSSGTAGAAMGAQFDTSKEIVKCASGPLSSAPTKFGMGSHGGATQSGMVDTSRNIVKPGCG